MTNAFDTAIAAAASTVRAVAGRTVAYSRGEASVERLAWRISGLHPGLE